MPAPIPGQHLPSLPPSVNIAQRGRHLHDMLNRLTRTSGPRGIFASPAGLADMPIDTGQEFIGVATSDFASRSSSASGLCTVNQVTSTPVYNGDGTLASMTLTTPDTTDIPAYNPSNKSFVSGAYCYCFQDPDGNIAAIALDC